MKTHKGTPQSMGGLRNNRKTGKDTKMSKKTDKNQTPVFAVPSAGTMDIPLTKIIVDAEFNARKQGMDAKSIEEFSRTLKEEGLLQPVVVEPMDDGNFFLKAGFRRVAAATHLGWPTITATVKVSEGKDEKERDLNRYFVNVAENVARKNITPYDLAMRCKLFKEEYGISGSEIARRLGKNVGYINNLLNVVGAGEEGNGVISEILKQWEVECAWPEEDKRTKVCKTDWLNRVRKLSKEGQLDAFNREMFIAGGGDPEKYDAGKKDGQPQSTSANRAGAGGGDNMEVRASKAELTKALEAVKAAAKAAKGEQKVRLNGVMEGLEFALGVKKGLTNRIKGIVAFKDGKMTEGATASN